MTFNELREDVAKMVFRSENPRSVWLDVPYYAQAERQKFYTTLAGAIINQVLEALPLSDWAPTGER